MKVITLNGGAKLYGYKTGFAPALPQDVTGEFIPSNIPSNIEIDLMNAGLLPNIYEKNNVEKTRAYELHDWWYIKDFTVDEIPADSEAFLVFDGVDTYADYFLNGVKIGESDNMLIAHEFPTENLICDTLISYLEKQFPELTIIKSASHREVIQYI